PHFYKATPTGTVRAWFWGHEHEFVEFKEYYQDLPFGNCLGHGAIPVPVKKRPLNRKPKYDGLASKPLCKTLSLDKQGYYRNGFSILQLKSNRTALIEHYEVDPVGKPQPLGTQLIC